MKSFSDNIYAFVHQIKIMKHLSLLQILLIFVGK